MQLRDLAGAGAGVIVLAGLVGFSLLPEAEPEKPAVRPAPVASASDRYVCRQWALDLAADPPQPVLDQIRENSRLGADFPRRDAVAVYLDYAPLELFDAKLGALAARAHGLGGTPALGQGPFDALLSVTSAATQLRAEATAPQDLDELRDRYIPQVEAALTQVTAACTVDGESPA